jgi:hypothetical protein
MDSFLWRPRKFLISMLPPAVMPRHLAGSERPKYRKRSGASGIHKEPRQLTSVRHSKAASPRTSSAAGDVTDARRSLSQGPPSSHVRRGVSSTFTARLQLSTTAAGRHEFPPIHGCSFRPVNPSATRVNPSRRPERSAKITLRLRVVHAPHQRQSDDDETGRAN